jgi:hypothetical protein
MIIPLLLKGELSGSETDAPFVVLPLCAVSALQVVI